MVVISFACIFFVLSLFCLIVVFLVLSHAILLCSVYSSSSTSSIHLVNGGINKGSLLFLVHVLSLFWLCLFYCCVLVVFSCLFALFSLFLVLCLFHLQVDGGISKGWLLFLLHGLSLFWLCFIRFFLFGCFSCNFTLFIFLFYLPTLFSTLG